MDVRAWSLLTGQPTLPPSLWEDLQDRVRPEARDNNNLYASHLPAEVIGESWARFAHALRPLHEAGRLGAVLLQYPHWFTPKDVTREELVAARASLPDYRVSVEFATERWVEPDELDAAIQLFEDHDMRSSPSTAQTSGRRRATVISDHPAARPRRPALGATPARPTWLALSVHPFELAEWLPASSNSPRRQGRSITAEQLSSRRRGRECGEL